MTYSFFQVIKLYDLQIRLADDRPLLLLPGIFPRFYGPQDVRKGEVAKVLPTEVDIPTHLVEGWRAPSVFLTRYFSVDRELSTQISGWALRLRISFDDNPEAAIRLFAEGLVVAARYLYGLDPSTVVKQLAETLRQFCQSILEGRRRAANNYGVDKGDTVQVNTPGVYVDALRGRCTACPDHEEADRYVDVMTKLEELRRLQRASELDDKEIARRTKRLDAGDLEPFEPAPATP